MKYRYTLDKSSKKFHCPSCEKKTFVRYVDAEANKYLENGIGRCDRETKCQYHKTPKGNQPIVDLKVPVKQLLPSYHNDSVLLDFFTKHTDNCFVNYLLKHFVPVDVKKVIQKYFIGTSAHWRGATIFWQVDEQMNVCAGKVMLYDKFTGKRIKEPFTHINWMHCVLQLKGFVLQQCLFGIHNLCDYKEGDTVCLVESEKTAVIMSLIFPSYLWLAAGSKSNLKVELLNPLKDYSIIVFPDKAEFEDWNKKTELFATNGFNIICSNLLENKNLENGGDLVDLFLTSNKL